MSIDEITFEVDGGITVANGKPQWPALLALRIPRSHALALAILQAADLDDGEIIHLAIVGAKRDE